MSIRSALVSASLSFLAIGCGGAGVTKKPTSEPPADMAAAASERGALIDYFTNTKLVGLTITDGQNTATSAADGTFALPSPTEATLAPTVSGSSGGSTYGKLHLPAGTATAAIADRGPIPMPTTDTFALEQDVLNNDQTKALVQIIVLPTGACTAIAGGTLTVNSPAGAMVKYFANGGLPSVSATSFAEVDGTLNKPAAVVYNVELGQQLDLTIDVPGCTMAPKGTAMNGLALDGTVDTTEPTEPGDVSSSLVFMLQ